MRFCLPRLSLAAACVLALMTPSQAPAAKNVILMITDGQGFNGWEAAKFHEGGLPYDNENFIFFGCSTFMLGADGEPQGYCPARMWSQFNYHRGSTRSDYARSFADSAAAATALNTGRKTIKGAVCVDKDGCRLTTIAQLADKTGKATGAVSSVHIVHATPACVWAHNKSRNDYKAIADEMIHKSKLDVIMGCGGPGEKGEYKYVGGRENWLDMNDDGRIAGRKFINRKADFQALAAGKLSAKAVVGVAAATSTLADNDADHDEAEDVPNLATMTRGALNVLAKDPDGFFLMIEGGAVDWANHKGDIEYMLREQADFNKAVRAVMAWVDANSSWDETLLIITADHECGSIWGPGTVLDDKGTAGFTDDTISPKWQNVVDNGKGKLPSLQYCSGGHTNALVPLWVRGSGAKRFAALVKGIDAKAAQFWDEFGGTTRWNGAYVDNTDVFKVINCELPR